MTIKNILIFPFIIIFLIIFTTIIWMNLSPGHFQFRNNCCGCCKAEYITNTLSQNDSRSENRCWSLGICTQSIKDALLNPCLLLLSNLDFNK